MVIIMTRALTFSPRMRGCSGKIMPYYTLEDVFPAYAGMFRWSFSVSTPPISFSPRMRGCSSNLKPNAGKNSVFPAYAGMFRPWRLPCGGYRGFPRVCGDVPTRMRYWKSRCAFSPRMRGCSWWRRCARPRGCVFPAYAGMFRSGYWGVETLKGFPRVCGDVPNCVVAGQNTPSFSPRMRGCSARDFRGNMTGSVFPAYAGMFPLNLSLNLKPPCFPRVCGDVPLVSLLPLALPRFSPRMRGCSDLRTLIVPCSLVFPAYAGMFRLTYGMQNPCKSFPRVCGDVPQLAEKELALP